MGIFSPPSAPAVPPPPPVPPAANPPSIANAAVQAAGAAGKSKTAAQRGMGFSGTDLTTGIGGASASSGSTAKQFLGT